MKLERTKNAKRSIIFGVILKIYQVLVPFFMRTALVYFLGMEYIGLNSFFTSILSILMLAELGVEGVIVYSMYKPIAEDDKDKICSLMQLYKLYYRIVGVIILLIGLCLTPLLPYLIKGDFPEAINLYGLYYINLIATVLSYLFFAHKKSLLSAYQRLDVMSKITLLVDTPLYIGQIIVLIFFKNYYVYILLAMSAQFFINIVSTVIVSKMYPEYEAGGKLSKSDIKEINHKVKDLFMMKVGDTIINSADAIVISSFLGLAVLAIYNNYYYVVVSIIGMAAIGYSSLTAGIGNSLMTESKEKNYNDFGVITYISMWAVCMCTCCFLNLFQPFMQLWMGKANMLDMNAVVCFALYFVVYEINAVFTLFKDAAGIWHQDRYRPFVVSMINLFLNLATVKILGIYGVLMSTVISMGIIGIPWIIHNLFTTVFNQNELIAFIKKMLVYLLEMIGICSISCLLCNFVTAQGVSEIAIKLVISVVISVSLFTLCNLKSKELKGTIRLVRKMIGKNNFEK